MTLPVAEMLKKHGIKEILERLNALETIIVTQKDTISALESTITTMQVKISSLEETLSMKGAIIHKFQSMLFDTKSEKGTSLISPIVDVATSVQHPAGQRGQRNGAPGHGRRLYEELPPREVIHELPEDKRRCLVCGKLYEECGTEDATELEWNVKIQRVVHRRKKYIRTCHCPTPKIKTTPTPSKLIPKGLLAVSAISNLLVNKFLHGQPINRQLNEIELLCGVRFSPGTIVGVQDKVGNLLRPLYDEILLHLRDADHWHADETRWMQYGDENKHRWWLWLFASADAVTFVLDPSRSRAVPRLMFGLDDDKPATGTISCDRWKSYQGLPGLLTAYCWAHVRRDFTDFLKGYPRRLNEWAQAWIARIGTLYHLNEQRLLYEPGTEEFLLADETLREHVTEMERNRRIEMLDTSLNSDACKALKSLARHWDGLTLFLDNPAIPLDNNEAERLLRTSVVGRKNFYGSGSLKSGALAECAYTILLTAVKNCLNPLTYLRAYLNACADNGGKVPTDISRFLPWQASAEDIAAWKLSPTDN